MATRTLHTRKQATIKLVLLTLLFLNVFAFPAFALAQNASTTQNTSNSASGSLGGAAQQNPEAVKVSDPIKIEDNLNESSAANFIYGILLSIGGFFVWLGGLALDTTLSLLVVGMGDFVRGSMLVAINELWTIIRDIFNILFIFGLIYIGFRTILGIDETGTKRMLGYLITAALLVNFSLLFTKSVVDFSNATAYQIYKLTGGSESVYQAVEGDKPTYGIAASFMQVADLTSYANTKTKEELSEMSASRFIIYGFFVMLLMLMAAFVFLAGAFMLIARFVILILSMIFSPAMFLGFVFPQFSGLSSWWWNKFLSNAFMAPAYLFMLFLTLKTIQTINTSGSIFAAFQGNSYITDSFGVIVIFFVMIAFLYSSLLVAQKMGAAGASQAIGAGSAIRKRVQSYATSAARSTGGLAVRGGGRLAQATVGSLARGYGEQLDRNRAKSGKARSRWWGRPIRSAVDKVGNASYGARTTVKQREEEDAKEFAEAKRAHAVHNIQENFKQGGTAAEKAAANASNAQIQEIASTEAGRDLLLKQAGALTSGQIAELMKSDKLNDNFKESLGQQVSEQTFSKLTQEAVADISKASKAQLKAIGSQKLSDPSVAIHLTADQIKHVESEMTEGEATQIKTKRSEALGAVVDSEYGAAHGKTMKDLLGMNPSELPKDILVKLAPQLPVSTVKKIAADNKFDIAAANKIRAAIEPKLKKPPKDPSTGEYIKPGHPDYKEEYDMWRFLNIEDRGRAFGRVA